MCHKHILKTDTHEIAATATLNLEMSLWPMCGSHRTRHMLVKHSDNDNPQTEHIVLVVFYKHVPFVRCALNNSHNNILKFKVAVTAVPWVLIFKICLWQGFWARQIW